MLPEHLFIRVLQEPLERSPNASFPRFNRKLLKKELAVRPQGPVKLGQGLAPIWHMVNDSKIDREIKGTVGERKLCSIRLQKPGVVQTVPLFLALATIFGSRSMPTYSRGLNKSQIIPAPTP